MIDGMVAVRPAAFADGDLFMRFLKTRSIFFAIALFQLSDMSFAHADDKEMLDTISVVGSGELEIVPDEFRFSVGIDSKAPDVQTAYESVERNTAEALKLLRRLGVKERNTQAMTAHINPVIDYKSRDRHVVAHEVKRDINVKVNDAEIYAKALQQLAAQGITRFGQLQMEVSNEREIIIQALEKAYANAEEKAQRLASKGNRRVDKLITLVESGAAQPRAVFKSQPRALAIESDTGGGAASVSVGVITIKRQVQATFALN